jgi:hypothetical protein
LTTSLIYSLKTYTSGKLHGLQMFVDPQTDKNKNQRQEPNVESDNKIMSYHNRIPI